MPRVYGLRITLLLLLGLTVIGSRVFAQAATSLTVRQAGALSVDPLSPPVIDLGGMWQFHPGDDPRWADPDFDDSGWGKITTDKGWDLQGYPGDGGFGWYRRHLRFPEGQSHTPPLALLYPTDGNNVYEAFWNGRSLGACGEFPPHDRMVTCLAPVSLPAGAGVSAGNAVIAIRVWAPMLGHLAPSGAQGLTRSPRLGSLQSARAVLDQELYHDFRSDRANDVLIVLYAVATLLAFFTFVLNTREPLYGWLALFLLILTVSPCVALWAAYGNLSWEWDATSIWVVSYLAQFVTLWFLLLRLFQLDSDRVWRWTTIGVVILSTAATLIIAPLSLTMAHWGSGTATLYRVDWWTLTITELYPFVIIIAGLKRKLDSSRWAVAIAATLAYIWPVIYNTFQLLQHWDIADSAYAKLTFQLGGGDVGFVQITRLVLLLALGNAAIHTLREARRGHLEAELELRSAHEVQQILIPENLPSIPGFALSSAYKPAREVGGDFFQVVPLDDGSTFYLIGDVSGKGLRAGMMVALITGAARTSIEVSSDPDAMLNGLNLHLHGRMQGGFATSLALRLFSDGTGILANAGHLAPLMNGAEVSSPPSLPLGLDAAELYQPIAIKMQVGDTLTLYTDGVPEARDSHGELFGFERTAEAVAELGSAERIAHRAQSFGQEDDITVLTVTRLATA